MGLLQKASHKLTEAQAVAWVPLILSFSGLGLSLWGVAATAMEHNDTKKDWFVGLVIGIFLLVLMNVTLLLLLLASRRRHRELLEALLPRAVLTRLHDDGSLMYAKADTPADLLLNMMGELLEGRLPNLQDVMFIRTALLSNMDVYQPLNLRSHIKEANLDAEVAQSLMRELGGGGAASTTTGGGLARRAIRSSAFARLSDSATGASALAAPGDLRPSASGKSFFRQRSQLQQPGCDTLVGALALILTPQPLGWQDSSVSIDAASDFLPPSRDWKPGTGPLTVAATCASQLPAGPGPPSGLLEKAASLLLNREKSRRRGTAELQPQALDFHRGSTEGTGRRTLQTAISVSVKRRSLAGVAVPLEHPGLPLSELRAGVRRSCGAVGDDATPKESSSVTTEAVDADSTGGGGGSVQTGVNGDVSVPRRLSAVWDLFGRRATASPGGLGSPRKGSLDGRPSPGTRFSPAAGSFSIFQRPASVHLSGVQQVTGAADSQQLTVHSRLGMGPSRPVSVRPSALVGEAGSPVQPVDGSVRRSAAPPLPLLEEVERLLSQADGWQFDTWALQEATQGHGLSALGFYLIHKAGLITCFRLPSVTLARLLRQIEAGYVDNPYHNAVHAADVLQTLHVIIHAAQLHVHYLDPLGLLAAYYSAIVHDFAHPGLTSDFLIATSDPLAVRYNDRSPLENHHCAASFSLLQRPELDALAPLSAAERAAFRKQVIDLVLATDMKQHFSILSHFNTVHRLSAYSQQQQQQQQPGSSAPPQSNRPVKKAFRRTMSRALSTVADVPDVVPGTVSYADWSEPAPTPVDDTERLLSLQVALKVADIGHLGEALDVHQRWLRVLEEEFFRQGDRERALGLPISPLFDRAKQGVSKSQVGFYDFVALPLVHAVSSAFPSLQPLMKCFLSNYRHWKDSEAAVLDAAT